MVGVNLNNGEALTVNDKHTNSTEFAPTARESVEVVRTQYEAFTGTHCSELLDALPNMVMALNRKRQVVFASKAFVEFLGLTDLGELLGRRPGEVLGCVNATAHAGGCGSSRYCRNCSVVATILSAFEGSETKSSCNLLLRKNSSVEGLDLLVSATPLDTSDHHFVIFSIVDITHESRRRMMERIFFHDVLNLAGGIRGLSEMLESMAPDTLKGEFEILRSATDSLVDEVMSQRDISDAESNELNLTVNRVDSLEILRKLRGIYTNSPAARGRIIVIDTSSVSIQIVTDERLVHRVLGNMLKNALEALPLGAEATISCAEIDDTVVISVHNTGYIPQEVQDNIFRRRFSTKGTERGIGTYSMLLIAERYLKGSVFFSSTENDGTTFYLKIPKSI